MTSLQLQSKQLKQTKDLEERKQAEQERHNRAEEAMSRIGNAANATKAIADIAKVAALNDLSWHANSKAQLEAKASLSWGNPKGALRSEFDHADPGILVTTTLFNPGVNAEADAFASLQEMAVDLFARIRAGKSGTAPYAPADIMMMMFTVASCIAGLAHYSRAYKVMNMDSNANNLYIKSGLMQSLRMNPVMVYHRDEYYSILTEQFRRLQKFYIPANIPLFQYAYAMYAHVLVDGDIRGEMYVNYPEALWKYSWDTASLMLEYLPNQGSTPITEPLTYLQPLITCIDSLYNNSDTFEIMRADIASAFDKLHIPTTKVTPPKWEEALQLEYDTEILEMMRNASFVMVKDSLINHTNITQSDDKFTLKFDPFISNVSGETLARMEPWSESKQVVSDRFQPTAGDTMLLTRWTAFHDMTQVVEHDENVFDVFFKVFPMMALMNVHIYQFERSTTNAAKTTLAVYPMRDIVGSDVATVSSIYLRRIFRFKYAPEPIFSRENNATGRITCYPLQNTDNFAILTVENLSSMNILDSRSLWGSTVEE